jgi:DDE superfamily endonuclease
MGREHDSNFGAVHRILSRTVWSSRAVAGRLLILLIAAFALDGAPIVIGIDDTIERRWGPKISARGIYHDPVRSSEGHFVKSSGLRWTRVLCSRLDLPTDCL